MPSFLQGLLLGFSIAIPVGPVGMLCLRRSLVEGRLVGFVSGLGAATADALYGLVAVLGLTAITNVLVAQRAWLQLGGGIFLVCLGVTALRTRPPAIAAPATASPNLLASYLSILGLTLTNPMTILAFVGIFAGLGVGTAAHGAWPDCLLVAGVFLGSAAWWLLLSLGAGWLGSRLNHRGLRALNVFSGVVILAFGVWQLTQLALHR